MYDYQKEFLDMLLKSNQAVKAENLEVACKVINELGGKPVIRLFKDGTVEVTAESSTAQTPKNSLHYHFERLEGINVD